MKSRSGKTKTAPAPPRLARAILSRALPSHLRADAIDDLDEEYRLRLAEAPDITTAKARARRWYRSQVLRSIGPALVCRWRGAAATRPPAWDIPEHGTNLLRALRISWRSLARAPGFTGLTLLMLVIGIGSTAGAFSLIDAVLIHPLPYPDADRIVYLYGSELEAENLERFEGTLASFAAVAVHGVRDVDIDDGVSVERAVSMPVSTQFFTILRATPAHGRLLGAADFASDSRPAAVITHRLAVRRVGTAENAVGR